MTQVRLIVEPISTCMSGEPMMSACGAAETGRRTGVSIAIYLFYMGDL